MRRLLGAALAHALGLFTPSMPLPPVRSAKGRREPPAPSFGSLDAAAAYRRRKSIHPGTSSSLRKVQKALRIEAGVRAP
jgi:hypothetical protein